MILDRWVALCLAPLAMWVLLNGLDDLAVNLVCLYHWLSTRLSNRQELDLPSEADLKSAPSKRIAVFVPLWKEHRVIERMLEHNYAATKYDSYDFFVGAYPNDGHTIHAVQEARKRIPNVHLAVCPDDGPTTKSDCLNWIYQRMLLFEEENDVRFDMIVTHDAEDLIHPQALDLISYFGQTYDMVQIPVLPLPTPYHELTHGTYCDDFAEYQSKDMEARKMLGGFIPSAGVGAGYSRAALEKLAAVHSNRIFEPGCLTEDYENGLRLHRMQCAQIFVPVRFRNGGWVATREFFPRRFKAAVKQRARWIMGIALQSWERHGWSGNLWVRYWFWRDRKGLAGNLLTPLSNVIFFYGLATLLYSMRMGQRWGLADAVQSQAIGWVCLFTLSLQIVHMGVRAWFCSRIYGWRFAAWVPVRTIWGNWLNCFATLTALHLYFKARILGRPLVWVKTEHAYPSRAALMEHKRRLGEVLVGSEYVSDADLEMALSAKPADLRIGEYLVRLGKLSEYDLYEALSLQQNLPLGKPDPQTVSLSITRCLPAQISRKWKVLPFKVASGHLYLLGPELPTEEMSREVREFSSLELRFQLVTPTDFEELTKEYLPG